MAKKEPKYYVRSDGLHEAIRVIDGERVAFRGHTDGEVERKMIDYKAKIERGPLFPAIAEKWKDQHFQAIALSTAKGYVASYNRAINRFKEIPIKELTAGDISALLKQMGKQQFSRKVVSTQRLVINLICDYAIVEEGILKHNPCASVKVPNGLKYSPREIPSDEELDVVKEGWDKPGGLLPYFILYTGCRRGEAMAITFKDIDRKKKIIRINKSVCYADTDPFIKTPKSAAGYREIILLDKLAEVLPLGIGDTLLFPGTDGGIMRNATLRNRWNRWRKKTGLTLTPHQLRHGYATMLFEAGIPERDAMDLLGHADIKLTHNIYTHIRKTRKDNTAAILNQAAEKF